MAQQEHEYPIVTCDAHPGVREPGYMRCNHINKPTDVFYFEKATESALGVISCEECTEHFDERAWVLTHFVPACAQGLREAGYNLEVQ